MRKETWVALFGLFVVGTVTAFAGSFGLTLLPLVFLSLAEVAWGRQRGLPPAQGDAVDRVVTLPPLSVVGDRTDGSVDRSALLIAAVNGTDGDVRRLFEELEDGLLQRSRRIGPSRGLDPNDLFQEVCLKLLRELKAASEADNLDAWLTTFVVNRAGDLAKSDQRRRVRDDRWSRVAAADQVADATVEDVVDLIDWLATQPVEVQMLLILKEAHGLSWPEVVATMALDFPSGAWTVGRARSVHARALAEGRRSLREDS